MTDLLPDSPLFLMPTMALCVTQGEGGQLHRHAAAQIAIGLVAPLEVRPHVDAPFATHWGVVVTPNTAHQIAGPGPAALMLWVETADVIARMRGPAFAPGIVPVPDHMLQPLPPALRRRCATLATCGDARALADAVRDLVFPQSAPRPTLDPRVAMVVARIKAGAYADDPRPIGRIAADVHLSPSRLRHLFKHEMGMALQRYILWQRIVQAVGMLGQRASLTAIAHAAGFADSAHFTRVFRAAFGSSPSVVLKHSHSVQVVLCDE